MTTELLTANQQIFPGRDSDLPLSSPAIFWRVEYLRPSQYLEHLPFLFWLVSELRPTCSVTLGLDQGTAHFALCQAVEKLMLETRCWGIALEDGASAVAPELQAYNDDRYPDLSRLTGLSLAQAGEALDLDAVDLLVVDTTPDEALLDALENDWMGRLRDHGVLVLRGTAALPFGGDIRRRIAALGHGGQLFEFEHGGGLMLLSAGQNRPDRLDRLLAASDSPADYRAVRQMFRRLGAPFESELQTRTAKLEAPARDLAAARQALADLEAQHEALKTRHETLSAAYDERHRTVAAAQAEVFDLRTGLQEQTGRADETARALDDSRAALARLETDLAQVKSENDSMRAALQTLAETEAARDDWQARAEAALAEVDRLAAALDARGSALAEAEAARDGWQVRGKTALAEVDRLAAALDARDRTLAEAEAARDTWKARGEAAQGDIALLTGALEAQAEAAAAARDEWLTGAAPQEAGGHLDLIARITGREARIAELADEVHGLQTERDALAAAQQARFGELSMVMTQLEALQGETAGLTTALDEARAAHEARKQEQGGQIAGLTGEVHRLQAERDDLATAQQTRADELSEAMAQIEALRVEAARAAALGQERDGLATEVAGLTTALDAARAVQQARTQEHDSARAVQQQEIDALRQSLVDKDSQIAELTGAYEEVRSQAEDLLGSTSWKLSAPLRQVSTALRRIGK